MTLRRTLRPRRLAAALLLAAAAAHAQVDADQTVRIGQNALYFEDYMLSIQYFNQAIAAKPYLAHPYLLRAIAKLNLDDWRGAEADATAALELNPFLTDAWEVRGVARQNSGRYRAATDDYSRALELLPRNRQLMQNRALALTAAGDTAAARAAFDELLAFYPASDNGLLGRARIELAAGDTAAAAADIERALAANPNALNAYIMRADIAIGSGDDSERALADIDRAIKLQPRSAGLYINRAYLRYRLDDYRGAMADYDYALTLEPYNMAALFNRGLLLMEVNANDRALADLDRALELEPDDARVLYNRAVVLGNKGRLDEAIADISRVAEQYPELPAPLYMRGNYRRRLGHMAAAEADYKKAEALARALPRQPEPGDNAAAAPAAPADKPEADNDAATRRRFARLITIADNADFREEYNNTAIRGRVQDRNTAVETEPLMMLSFYTSPGELRHGTHYLREVEDLNATRSLRYALAVTNRPPAIDEATAARHFQSVDYYNSYLATHAPRPVDYIGRALDFITVRDYRSAVTDATRAIDLAPGLALAYIVRSQARYGLYRLGDNGESGTAGDAAGRSALARGALADIAADIDKAIELSPASAVLWYNKGNILFEAEDYDGAEAAWTKAIELKSDFGEAYFNRGYVELRSGRRASGIADLSKAGELGIVPAYNLIKRISN